MITAIEANRKRTELINNCKTYNLIKINEQINKAIEKGRRCIIYEHILSKEEEEKLKSIGYDVKYIWFPFSYWKIFW